MAKKLVLPSTVTVYDPKGKPEQHTRANARDLVNGAGYTWDKKKAADPTGFAPFAIPQNTKFAQSKAQEILDRARSVAPQNTGDSDDGDDVVQTVIEEEDEEVENIEEVVTPVQRKPRTPRAKPAPVADAVEGIDEES